MPFHPQVGDQLTVDGTAYHIAEHPAAPGIPYGQEGRQAIVFQLVAESGEKKALKVFKPRYRFPGLVSLAEQIAPYAGLPGLQVCQRKVLSARRHGALLRQHPDLTYAVLMPWVEGPTWMEVLLRRGDPAWSPLTPEQSLALARALAGVLAAMEEQRLAHGDLSGPNVLLPAVAGDDGVELVDVEGMYGPGLERPQEILSGSPGYAHKTAPDGLWGPEADRFAGAVLIAEMLGWCDERIREASWGESCFTAGEVQQESERYRLSVGVLLERWGEDAAGLFEQAWRSETLWHCPTFGEWLVRLPEEVPQPAETVEMELTAKATEPTAYAVQAMMALASRFEEQAKLDSALDTYRQAQALAPAGSGLAEELALIVQDLETKQEEVASVTCPSRREAGVEVISISLPLRDEAHLDQLFDDGLAAYERKEWERAKEMLAQVVSTNPLYQKDQNLAADLLARAVQGIERDVVQVRRTLLSKGGTIALILGLAIYGIGMFTAWGQGWSGWPYSDNLGFSLLATGAVEPWVVTVAALCGLGLLVLAHERIPVAAAVMVKSCLFGFVVILGAAIWLMNVYMATHFFGRDIFEQVFMMGFWLTLIGLLIQLFGAAARYLEFAGQE